MKSPPMPDPYQLLRSVFARDLVYDDNVFASRVAPEVLWVVAFERIARFQKIMMPVGAWLCEYVQDCARADAQAHLAVFADARTQLDARDRWAAWVHALLCPPRADGSYPAREATADELALVLGWLHEAYLTQVLDSFAADFVAQGRPDDSPEI